MWADSGTVCGAAGGFVGIVAAVVKAGAKGAVAGVEGVAIRRGRAGCHFAPLVAERHCASFCRIQSIVKGGVWRMAWRGAMRQTGSIRHYSRMKCISLPYDDLRRGTTRGATGYSAVFPPRDESSPRSCRSRAVRLKRG